MNENKKKEQGSNPLASFLALASELDSHVVPPDDAEDIRNGASHIPYEVTDIRRGGEKVRYLGNNKWKYKDKIIT